MESSNVIGDVHSRVEQNAAAKISGCVTSSQPKREAQPDTFPRPDSAARSVFSAERNIHFQHCFRGVAKERTIQSMPRR